MLKPLYNLNKESYKILVFLASELMKNANANVKRFNELSEKLVTHNGFISIDMYKEKRK